MLAEAHTPLRDDAARPLCVPPCIPPVSSSLHDQAGSAALNALRLPPPVWTFEPWVTVALLLVAALYLHRRLPRRFTLGCLLAFQAALCALFLALSSPLHEWSEWFLQCHMVQHLALMMLVPPLLWLGMPGLPLLRGLPRVVLRYGLRYLFGSATLQRLGRWLTHPVVCWLGFTVSNVAWHVPSLYELALHSAFWHDVQHLCFLGTGLLFWWPVVQPWPSRSRWPRWTILPYLLLADIQNTALSAWLIFSERVLYPSYAAVPRVWGLSALDDQAAAGALMWVPGSIGFLLPAGVLVIRLLDSAYARPRQEAACLETVPETTRHRQSPVKNSQNRL